MKKILLIGSSVFIILLIAFFVGFFIVNNKKSDGIIVLSYHHLLKEKDKNKYKNDDRYVISVEAFEEQMQYLKDNNYNNITVDDIKCYMKKECSIPEKAFIVTLDDGNISSYYYALPILEKYGYNSIIFVIGSRIQDETVNIEDSDKSQLYFLGRDILDDIHNNHPSMTIASHSHELHGNVNGVKLVDLKTYEELLEDSTIARNELYDTTLFAYPFSKKNDNITNSLKEAGFKMAFISNVSKKATPNDDIMSIPRIDISSDYSIKEFKNAIEEKMTLKEYTKFIIKKLLNKN